jgi:hypothetical protein
MYQMVHLQYVKLQLTVLIKIAIYWQYTIRIGPRTTVDVILKVTNQESYLLLHLIHIKYCIFKYVIL